MGRAFRLILPILLLALIVAESASRAADAPRRVPMFAAYYVWYSTAAGPHARWSGWGGAGKPSAFNPSGHDPDRSTFPPHLRDIASAAYPLIGPYDSDDPEVVRWHIRLAKAAGIEAFMVSWWGPGTWQDVPRLTETAFEKVVLPIAREEGFKVALMDETAQFHHDFDQVKRWAVDYLRKYKDNPAYLRIDGKPVYYLYQTSIDPQLTPESFPGLVAHVEAEIGPVHWILDKINNAHNRFHIPAEWLERGRGKWRGTADVLAFYSTFSNFRTWTYPELIGRYTAVVRAAHDAGAKMMVPVHPGHDNSRLRERDFFVMPRDDGKTLRGYLSAARDSGADYILVTSFNEWPETTVIEPAATWVDPYLYLRILADFNGERFRAPAEPERIHLGRAMPTSQPR